MDSEGLRGLLGRDCFIYWGVRYEARTAADVLLSEKPGPVHSGPSEPFCSVLPMPPIFQTAIIWAVASLLIMSRKGQGMMQLPKESRNLPAQPQFRIPHETGAEGS